MHSKPFCFTAIITMLLFMAFLQVTMATISRKVSTIVGSTDETVPQMYRKIFPRTFHFHPNDEQLIYFTTPAHSNFINVKLLNLTSGLIIDAIPGEAIFSTTGLAIDGRTSDIYYLNQGFVYKYSPSTNTKVLFAGGGTLTDNFIPANQAQIQTPLCLAVDQANGDLIIAESRGVMRVRNRILSTVAGGGTNAYLFDGPVTNLQDYRFKDVLLCDAHDETIYFYDSSIYNTIFKISKDGSMVNVAGNGHKGFPKDNVLAKESPLIASTFSVNYQSGEIFFGTTAYIMKVDQSGYIRAMSNMTSNTAGIQHTYNSPRPDDGSNSVTLFLSPYHLVISPLTKNLYFSEIKGRIAKITNSASTNKNDWKIETLYGAKSYSLLNVPALYSKLSESRAVIYKPDSNEWYFQNGEYYMKTAKNGNSLLPLVESVVMLEKQVDHFNLAYSETESAIYFTDAVFLYKLNILTMEKTLFAGNGRRCIPKDGSPQLQDCVCQINGLVLINGQLYYLMTSQAQSFIFTFENGRIKLVAGGGKDIFSSNIAANETAIGSGAHFALGPQNEFYISDNKNRIIKVINSKGLVSVVAGSKDARDYGHDGIKATDAAISPYTIDVLPYGDIIFAEDNRIRKISKKTGKIYTVYGDFDPGYTPDGLNPPDQLSHFLRPEIMGSIQKRNEIYFFDQIGGQDFSTQLRTIKTECDLGEYLDEDWKSCSKCPAGKFSSSDFSGCEGEMIYCNGVAFNSPNVCSAHGKCNMESKCQCMDNWFGDNCAQTTCNSVSSKDSSVCGGHGSCVNFNQCQCKESYFGQSCEFIEIPQNAFKLYFNTSQIRIGIDDVCVVMTSNFNIIPKQIAEYLENKNLIITLTLNTENGKYIDSRSLNSKGIPIYSIFDLSSMKDLNVKATVKGSVTIYLDLNQVSQISTSNDLIANNNNSNNVSYSILIVLLSIVLQFFVMF